MPLYPNDIKKGAVVLTRDGAKQRVADNKKGLVRMIENIPTPGLPFAEMGSCYSYEWRRLVQNPDGSPANEEILIPDAWAKKIQAIASMGF